jgi:hypothetical protein
MALAAPIQEVAIFRWLSSRLQEEEKQHGEF